MLRLSIAMIGCVCVFSGAAGQGADALYKDKQIRMVVGSGAGGGYDVYARVLARHLSRHIPGAPAIVVQNMPGAAGMLATNWAYNSAPKDGSVILATYNAILPDPLYGDPAVQFDPLKFEWVGSIGKQQNICATWYLSPIKTIDDAKQREVNVASTGASCYSATMPPMLNALLGTKFKVIIGYATTEARLAVERGEAEGICGLSWSTLKASNPDWVQNKRINIIVQTGNKAQAELPDVPVLVDLVTDPTDKRVVELISFPEDLGRPFAMPPGTPSAMVETVRRAFDATMRDPAFVADAGTASMEVDPVTGAEMQAILERNYATPKALVDRAAKLLASPAN